MPGPPNSLTSPAQTVPAGRIWTSLLLVGIGAIYLGVSLEWLFFFTKHSFMTALAMPAKLRVLLVSPLPLVFAVAVFQGLSWGAAGLVKRHRLRSVCLAVGALAPALCLASTLLLLVDNFTYTVFQFGIITVRNALRLTYGGFFLGAIAVCCLFVWRQALSLARGGSLRRPAAMAAIALALSLSCAAMNFLAGNRVGADAIFKTNDKRGLPNILYVTIDGLNARNMSVYGYPRDTTPHLREFARECLVCNNHFSNAGSSGASFASQMTGKLPTETRLFYPPDVLRGQPAFQHLPGLLRKLGYRSIDMSERYYVDPFDLNMLDGFDTANYRDGAESRLIRRLAGVLDPDSCYFLSLVFDRIEQRLFHIFGLRMMPNAYVDVTETPVANTDEGRIDEAIAFMHDGDKPFFAHLHLLVTHGPIFQPRTKPFTHGRGQFSPWMRDYYDSSILHADEAVQRLIDHLKAGGMLDRTIVVVNSDHPEAHALPYRIPLLIRFPRGEHSGRLSVNTQNLDIAATLVDYLGLKQQAWLGGSSLLSNLDPFRILFSVGVNGEAVEVLKEKPGWSRLDESLAGPPFYGLGTLNAVVGDRYYEFNVRSATVGYCPVPGYAAPLDMTGAPTTETIKRALVDHLDANALSTPTLGNSLALKPIPLPYSKIIEDGIDVREVDSRKYPAPYVPSRLRKKNKRY